ncbi:hypothetical protein L6R52_11985 [Myxococcota bacterium]|nr:hypothetical protein [Myxococcota bacterium]
MVTLLDRARAFGITLIVAALSATATGCIPSYTNALGYRSRQAALAGDVEAFDALMEEAADTTPSGPLDNPKKTVLSHFLDLGASDRFFPLIEAWRAKGWVSEHMTCAIHRARFRGKAATDRAEADRAADVCLDRARAAAVDPDRRWEVEACLAEAPFLVETSTSAIARYVALASDLAEPPLFRAGLLDGMTTVWLQDPGILRVNEPTISKEVATQRSRAQLDEARARFEWVLRGARRGSDASVIASGTALGALELERVSQAHGRSFVGDWAARPSPDDADLAWAWLRAAKTKKRHVRLDGLGVWDRNREPAGDAFWYLCARPPVARDGATAIEVISVLAHEPADPASIRSAQCAAVPDATVLGPYPLESAARADAEVKLGAPVRLVERVSRRAPAPAAP